MKIYTKLLIVAAVMFFAACRDQNINPNMDPSVLIGRWKMSETLADPGDGSGKWEKVSKTRNDYIDFEEDGKLSGNIYVDYKTYKVKDSSILTFTKADGVTYQNYMYKLEDGSLSLSPAGPIYCIEGCGTRYKKIE